MMTVYFRPTFDGTLFVKMPSIKRKFIVNYVFDKKSFPVRPT